MGRKAHCHIKTWNGGLLLDIEAPSLMFQHNGGVGVVKMPNRHIEMRQGGILGSGEAKQKKLAIQALFSCSAGERTCWEGWGCVRGIGNMSVELGTCW